MGKVVAAFFDIDGTIFRDSLMIAHFKKMREFRIIDEATLEGHVLLSEKSWQKRRVDYDEFLEEVSAAYVKSLMGVSYSDIMFTARHTVKSHSDEVYRFTANQIKYHLEQKHLVVFISGSPDFLVRHMAKTWNAHLYVGSKYVFQQGIFTGEIMPMWDSSSKLKTLNTIVEEHHIDLANSYAYGDTNGDFTMLKSVGHPYAINPARELLNNIRQDEALCERTTIVVERKDVIYRLRADVDTFVR